MYAEPVNSVGTVTLRDDCTPRAGSGDTGDTPPGPTVELGPDPSSAFDTSNMPVW